MRLIWHIFKKDARRLWWEIVVTLGLLAALAHMDRWRTGFTPGSMEGWLTVLLPLAWAYLIALAIHEEPLIGDRQFWVTLPLHWSSLLAAKALFAAAFIHLPYFLGCAAILAARGFQPLSYLPPLLWKQALLAAVLTLPAAALAAVLRNVTQFVLAAILIVAGMTFLTGGVYMYASPWQQVDGRCWEAGRPG